MSVIFQDPFMSDDQTFDKLLTELDYRDAKIESSIWQQYLYDFEEDLHVKSAVWQKYVGQSPDISRPVSNNLVDNTNLNKTSNDNQLDAWIDEILSLSPIQPQTSTTKHQETVQVGQSFGNDLSKMLETEPSTLTVIDTLVNNASPCSDILDLDICGSYSFEEVTSYSNTLYPNEMAATPTQRVRSACPNVPVLPQRFRRLNSSASYASESCESSNYSSEDETIQGTSDDDVKTVIPEPKPSTPKPVKKRRRYYKTRKPRLCQYLVELLNNPERNPSMMEWVDREAGIFRFTDSGAVARMWGQRRHKPDMKYENFARSLRTYIAKGVLRKLRSKLVYGFSVPSNWINSVE